MLSVFRTSTISYTLYSVASVQNQQPPWFWTRIMYHVHCALCNIVAVNYSTVFDLFEQYNNHKLLAVFDMLCAYDLVLSNLRVTQHKITLHKTAFRRVISIFYSGISTLCSVGISILRVHIVICTLRSVIGHQTRVIISWCRVNKTQCTKSELS